MNWLEQFFNFWDKHGTKVIGWVGSIVNTIAVINVSLLAMQPPQPPLFGFRSMVVLAALNLYLSGATIARGKFNTDQIAQKVVEKQADAASPGDPSNFQSVYEQELKK